jgi:hypothetical protein
MLVEIFVENFCQNPRQAPRAGSPLICKTPDLDEPVFILYVDFALVTVDCAFGNSTDRIVAIGSRLFAGVALVRTQERFTALSQVKLMLRTR